MTGLFIARGEKWGTPVRDVPVGQYVLTSKTYKVVERAGMKDPTKRMSFVVVNTAQFGDVYYRAISLDNSGILGEQKFEITENEEPKLIVKEGDDGTNYGFIQVFQL